MWILETWAQVLRLAQKSALTHSLDHVFHALNGKTRVFKICLEPMRGESLYFPGSLLLVPNFLYSQPSGKEGFFFFSFCKHSSTMLLLHMKTSGFLSQSGESTFPFTHLTSWEHPLLSLFWVNCGQYLPIYLHLKNSLATIMPQGSGTKLLWHSLLGLICSLLWYPSSSNRALPRLQVQLPRASQASPPTLSEHAESYITCASRYTQIIHWFPKSVL